MQNFRKIAKIRCREICEPQNREINVSRKFHVIRYSWVQTIYLVNTTVFTENVVTNKESIKNCSLLIGVDTTSPIPNSPLCSCHNFYYASYVYLSQFTRATEVLTTTTTTFIYATKKIKDKVIH